MTSPDRDYDEMLRRAFHAMADPIEPAGDGLARIRSQLGGPWILRQSKLLLTECLDLVMLLFIRSEPFLTWLRGRAVACAGWARVRLITAGRAARAGYARATGAARDRVSLLRPRSRDSAPAVTGRTLEDTIPFRRAAVHRVATRPRSGVGATLGWVRPALAVTSVVVLIAAGAVGLTRLRQTIMNTSSFGGTGAVGSQSNSGGQGPAGANGQGTVPGGQPSGSPQQRTATGKKTREPGGASPSASCGPGGAPSPFTSPAPSSSPSVSPTPSSTATPTPTSTPTPSPTGTSPTSGQTPTPSAATAGPAAVGFVTGIHTVSLPCSPAPSSSPSPSPSTTPPSPSAVTSGLVARQGEDRARAPERSSGHTG